MDQRSLYLLRQAVTACFKRRRLILFVALDHLFHGGITSFGCDLRGRVRPGRTGTEPTRAITCSPTKR